MANDFELFSAQHLTTILVIVVSALALPLVVRRFFPSATRKVASLLSALLMLQESTRLWMWFGLVGLSAQMLPLNLCTLSVLLSAWVLVTRSQRVFEIVYFWGFGGTTQALLTPDLQEGFPAASYLLFFLGHGGVIVALAYGMLVLGLRPHLDSIPRVALVTIGVASLAYAVNLSLGTNFMFLVAKPSQPSILDWFGPWPWYLLGLVLISLLSFFVLYLPFLVFDLSKRKSRAWRQ